VASDSHQPRIATLPPATAALAVDDLILTKGAEVMGHITAEGQPVAGVRVHMSTQKDGRNYWADDLCVAEAEGAAPGFSLPLKRQVTAPATDVDFDISGTALTVQVSMEGMDPTGLRIWSRLASRFPKRPGSIGK
jgi:hypothetical protein